MKQGFFHFFKPGEVLVREWDPLTEDFCLPIEPDQVARLQAAANLEFDAGLGVYPFAETHATASSASGLEQSRTGKEREMADPASRLTTYQRWLGLIKHISPSSLNRICPSNHQISGMNSVSYLSEELESIILAGPEDKATKSPVEDGSHASLERKVRHGFEQSQGVPSQHASVRGKSISEITSAVDKHRLNFTQICLKASFPLNSTGAEKTKYSIDKSYLLRSVLGSLSHGQMDLFAELEFSFLVFLLGQVWDGLEQWKTIIRLICESEEAAVHDDIPSIAGHPNFYTEFINLLRSHLQECPYDFFQDAISGDSFLRASLVNLTRHLQSTNKPRQQLHKLLDWISIKFNWDPRDEMELESDNDAPIIVDADGFEISVDQTEKFYE